MIGGILSEEAGRHEHNIALMEENADLKRTIDSLNNKVATLVLEADSTHVTNSTPIEGLSDEEEQILTFLAQRGKANLTIITGANFRDVVTAQYWLDKLSDRGMISVSIGIGGPAKYHLTQGGRAHMVENDLI